MICYTSDVYLFIQKFENVDNYIHFHLLRANLRIIFFLNLILFPTLLNNMDIKNSRK